MDPIMRPAPRRGQGMDEPWPPPIASSSNKRPAIEVTNPEPPKKKAKYVHRRPVRIAGY